MMISGGCELRAGYVLRTDKGVIGRFLMVGSLVLWGAVSGGCAATGETKPQVVSALAKPGNTYVVKRAAIRTPAADRLQRNRRNRQQVQPVVSKPPSKAATIVRTTPARATQRRRSPGQLTKAQYHARYQARLKAAAKAAAERKEAAARALLAQKKAQQQAIRNQHIARWKQQQHKRAQYNKNWQQQQASSAARKQAARKLVQARTQSARKTHIARKPVKQARRPDPRQKYIQRWEQQQAEKRLAVKRRLAEKRLAVKKAEQRVESVIYNAKKQIGRKYVWGGASPRQGFDCSGLVQHSMNKGANVKVPRTALQQYRAAVKVPAHQAERGDLVFFITRGKKVSHVGIYLGNNKFVHAPRTGKRITTSRLSSYWKKRFVGFGRIPGACRLPGLKA